MGTIERELRFHANDADTMVFSSTPAAYRCYWDAYHSLRRTCPHAGFNHPQSDDNFPDVMSEAIEAAGALNL
jgi:hypothetical protein